jgi:hypothetical protein
MHSFYFLVIPCFRFGRLSRRCIELLGVLQGIPRELVSLLAEFVSGLMIFFAVGDCCDGVGVGCQIVKFRGSIVRTLRHGVSSPHVRCKLSGRSYKKSIDAGGLLPRGWILGVRGQGSGVRFQVSGFRGQGIGTAGLRS